MKNITLLIILFVPFVLAVQAAPLDPRCEDKGGVKRDACCVALEAGALSKNSIYQADTRFTADSGREFKLDSLRGHPVVLAMFFARCGYACPLIVTDIQAIRTRLPVAMYDQVTFVLVSFDTERDQPAALAEYRTQRRLDKQWILLHGDKDSVRELSALLGVKYAQDTDGAFSHSNVITILNSQGEIIHQRVGLQGGLDEAASALVQGN